MEHPEDVENEDGFRFIDDMKINKMTEQKAPERISLSIRSACALSDSEEKYRAAEDVDYVLAGIATAHKEEAERLREALETISVQLPGDNASAKRIARDALAGKQKEGM